MVQWQNVTLPWSRQGFDSLYPLHIFMTAEEILNLVEKYEIRLVRRVGTDGWEWVAYNAVATGIHANVREAIKACASQRISSE